MKPVPSSRQTHDEAMWPLKLTGAELAGMTQSLGLSVAEVSPLASLTEGVSARSSVERPSHAVAGALRVLAAPRQLLLLRLPSQTNGGSESEILGFLNDGASIVRFDLGATGCMVGEPCTLAQFAQLVRALAGVEAGVSSEPGIAITRSFLDAVLACRRAGLFDSPDARLSLSEAEATIVPRATPSVSAGLRALEAEGLLRIEDSSVRAQPEWLTRYSFLTKPARLRLDVIELADIAGGHARTKRLAILGERPERIVVVPASVDEPGREVILELAGATTPAVASAVAQLLAPPATPPCSPTAECTSSVHRWLGRAPRENALPDWHVHTLDEVIAPTSSAVTIPGALLSPQVTIEVLAMTRGGTCNGRTLLALDASSAAEWTLEGSLLRWRSLSPGDLTARIDELIPARRCGDPDVVIDGVPTAEFKRIFEDPTHSAASASLPSRLRLLVDDATTLWYTIRTSKRVHGENRQRTILLACSVTGGAWRFDLAPGVVRACTVDAHRVRSALAAALED